MLSAPRDPPSRRSTKYSRRARGAMKKDEGLKESQHKQMRKWMRWRRTAKKKWKEQEIGDREREREAICILRKNSKNFFTPTRSRKYQPFYTRTRYFTRTTRSAVCQKRDDFLLGFLFLSKSFINEVGESSHDNADFSLSLSWLLYSYFPQFSFYFFLLFFSPAFIALVVFLAFFPPLLLSSFATKNSFLLGEKLWAVLAHRWFCSCRCSKKSSKKQFGTKKDQF